jgi:hypothetical protein
MAVCDEVGNMQRVTGGRMCVGIAIAWLRLSLGKVFVKNILADASSAAAAAKIQ